MIRALLVLAVLLAPLLAPRPLAAQPALRWGADATSGAPYVFADPTAPSRIIGYEKEIIEAVARHMGRSAAFVQNDWDGLIPGLGRGLYDVAIDGIEITPEHREAVDFSTPYLVTFEQLAVRRDEHGVTDLDSLKGRPVGTLKASQAQRILEAAPGMQIKLYDEETNAYADLAHGRSDAVLLDWPIALYYAAPDPALKLVGPPIGHLEYGIAVAKGKPALLAAVNAALQEMRETGELRRILERWALWTPAMATALNDPVPSTVAPTEYENFRAATAPAPDMLARLRRYAGFLPLILRAAVLTIVLSILAMAVAIVAGMALALARLYGPKPLPLLALWYIEVIRGTPLLIQILFVFYGLPNIGVKLDPFVAGVLALGLNYAAYEAENYRAGLLAIPVGQTEAARALALTHRQALRHVVVPQAARMVLPVMTNDFISLLKDSSLVSAITLTELTQTYEQLSTTYYDYFGTGLLIGAVYLLIGLPFVRLARWTERRMGAGLVSRRNALVAPAE
jgi:polar amino acid transport system substrate-binding protein